MNERIPKKNFLRGGWIIATLLMVLFVIPTLRAQPTEQTVQSHFLFVFDTSHSTKSRVDAVELSLKTMLATSMNGQLHAGDSMGVWTFNQTLQPKGYPLQNWNPDAAVAIASNMVKYVGDQHYVKTPHLEVLQPLLNRVMQGSERLTVVLFCDGESKMTGTPYDDAINQAFKEKSAQQRKANEPIVLVLRSQLGQYVACSMSLPPQLVSIPQFPPLPLPPPPPVPKPTNAPPPAPVIVGKPLIIIGKKPEAVVLPPVTNRPAHEAPEKAVPPVSGPAPVSTNATITVTNPVVAKAIDLTPTNPPPVPPENSGSGAQNFRLIGAGLLGAAIALGVAFFLRPRRNDTSLITRSMKERK